MFTSITKVENNRVAKFAEFSTLEECQSHADEYNGVVYEGSFSPKLYVENGVVTIVEVVEPAEVRVEKLKATLNELERNALMPRGDRETQLLALPLMALLMSTLTTQQKAALALVEAEFIANNPYYKGLKATNDEATALRAQIRELT